MQDGVLTALYPRETNLRKKKGSGGRIEEREGKSGEKRIKR